MLAVAPQAATEWHQPIGQVEAADHLDDLLERSVRTHEHTVSHVASLEKSAVAGEKDPMLGGGGVGQRSVIGIPLGAGVESHQSQQAREPAEVDIDDETRIAQRTGAHPG